MARLIDEIRSKYPGLARKADGGNPRAGIRLFCLECMGGNRGDVDGCETRLCPIWPWHKGAGTLDRGDVYPPLPPKKAAPAGGFGR